MIVRQAKLDDLADQLGLMREMHQESRFKDLDFDTYKVGTLFLDAFSKPDLFNLVLEVDGVVVGFMLAIVQQSFFGRNYIAQDLCLYIDPGHRGGNGAKLMIQLFESWAESRGAAWVELGSTTGIKEDRVIAFYKSMGYHHLGTVTYKELV